MTKYVLNSGGIKNKPALKSQFHLEIIKGLGSTPHILLCNFAQGREFWEAKFDSYAHAIAEDMPEGVTPSFDLAMPTSFASQCDRADIIYFHGGDDHLVQYWMRTFDYEKLFANKVVATNSASSDMIATHFWPCDWRSCMDGFGILPIKFIAHYDAQFDGDPGGIIDWQKGYDELAAYGDTSLPIYALKEGEFIVMEKGR